MKTRRTLFTTSLSLVCQAVLLSPAAAQIGSIPRKIQTEPFGYTAAFDRELTRIGQITPRQFSELYPLKNAYLEAIRWDPTTAKFWDRFSMDPANFSPANHNQRRLGRPYDFLLNAEELALLKRNGFVVSERMGGTNMGEMFYRIYSRDLPIFISSDAILHAWHRSYDAMLQEVEENCLMPLLTEMLQIPRRGSTTASNCFH